MKRAVFAIASVGIVVTAIGMEAALHNTLRLLVPTPLLF